MGKGFQRGIFTANKRYPSKMSRYASTVDSQQHPEISAVSSPDSDPEHSNPFCIGSQGEGKKKTKFSR